MSDEPRHAGASGYLDFEVDVGAGSGREYPLEVRSPAGEARDELCERIGIG